MSMYVYLCKTKIATLYNKKAFVNINTFKYFLNTLGYDMLILSFTNNALLKSKVDNIFNGLQLTQMNNEQLYFF